MTQPVPLNLSARRINLILLSTILSLYPLVGMAIDLLAPSLPAISDTLNAPHSNAKQIISFYLFGYLCGSASIGLSADCFGRRPLFLGCIALFVTASIGSIFATSIWYLLILRFLQGLSFGSACIVGRAISSDILPTQRLMQLMPVIAALWGLGPIFGPMIGGYLQFYFNWQACYIFFATYSIFILLSAFFCLPETNHNPTPFRWQHIKHNIVTILRSRHFLGMAIIMGFGYSSVIAFNVLTPFLLQDIFGKSPIYYGHVALSMGIIFLIGTFICRAALKRITAEKIVSYSLAIGIIVSIFSWMLSQRFPMNIPILLIASGIVFLSASLIYPAGMARCASLFRHIAATNAAMMMLLAMLLTTSSSTLLSFIPVHSVTHLLIIYLSILLAGLGIKLTLGRKTIEITEMG